MPSLDEPPEVAGEIVAGRAALDQGDLEEAVMRAARALAVDPASGDARAVLEAALDRGDDPLKLVAVEDGASFGVFAVRAFALARLGRLAEGLELLLQVAAFRPETPYLEWSLEWVNAHAGVVDRMTDAELAAIVVRLRAFARSVRGNVVDTDPRSRNVDAAIALSRALASMHPMHDEVTLLACILLRHRGRLDDAIALAERSFARTPAWSTAIELAASHRARGDIEEAAAYYEKGSALDPSDVAALLDLGDLLLERRRFDRASGAYRRALEREPGNAWAEASLLFSEACSNVRPQARDELARLARAGNRRARELLPALDGGKSS